jgi:hypothetical protein
MVSGLRNTFGTKGKIRDRDNHLALMNDRPFLLTFAWSSSYYRGASKGRRSHGKC